jgi:hypothetical protein
MNLTEILDQLAEMDGELQQLEQSRALAQTAADTAKVNRLQEEITRLTEARDELREQWKRQQQH